MVLLFIEFQLVTKKTENPAPYPEPLKSDPTFKDEVFRRPGNDKKVANLGKFKYAISTWA